MPPAEEPAKGLACTTFRVYDDCASTRGNSPPYASRTWARAFATSSWASRTAYARSTAIWTASSSESDRAAGRAGNATGGPTGMAKTESTWTGSSSGCALAGAARAARASASRTGEGGRMGTRR